MSNSDVRDKPVQYIKMVGPRKAGTMEKLGIYTLGDLLYHFPREYQDRSTFQPAHKYPGNTMATVKGTVLGVQDIKPRKKLTITRAAIHDGSGVFYGVWFNQPYIKKQLKSGIELIVTGKMDRNYGFPQVQVVDFEIVSGDQELVNSGRIVPVYPLTEKLGQRSLRQIIHGALEDWAEEIEEFIPLYIMEKNNLLNIRKALKQVHFPDTMENANKARFRFIFEELFVLQLGLALRRRKEGRQEKNHRFNSRSDLTSNFIEGLPYRLTGAQQRVWQEVHRNMESPYQMNRLVQGDVGSGKTIIGALALLKAAESGYQGALMAPTEVLAEQHYLNLHDLLGEMGVSVGLVSGSMPAGEKSRLAEQVASGKIQVVIGTHALIQETVYFKNLAVVIVDEQHRFGVRQRANLQYKGNTPDVLVMTATPIPRTLAMTLYGDLDISVIDEMPPGRQEIQTYAVKPSAIEKVYQLVRKEIDAGRQAYVVCALVEESEKLDVQPAVELASHLQNEIFTEYSIGLLHGRMSQDDKEMVMGQFREGSIHVLVSTSVIEVGVDVPNATVMVIMDAHRFGLAQLHQLRGRVGRGAHQSYCILVSDPATEEAKERLRAMTLTSDGFKLAEKDMKIRGPGEFFGTRQSGMPALKLADLVAHVKIMETAHREAEQLLKDDPSLYAPENNKLKAELDRRLSRKENYIDIS